MTILTMNRKDLERRIGKITKDVEDKITQMGTPVEEVTADSLSVEVFPNRPDLLSLENFSRSFNQFVKKAKVSSFKITPLREKLVVDKSVPEQWPFAVACVVKGLKFDDEMIKRVIDIQEKLHNSILRKRRKGGIGVYPLDKVSFPIRVVGRSPDNIVFRPLESGSELSAKQILKQHPAGVAYGSVCDGWSRLPVFVDAHNNVLSMPPIINSHDTGRVDESTKDVFVETTGNNLYAVMKAFTILVSSLYEMGGKVFSIECTQRDGSKIVTPDMTPQRMPFVISDIERTLGVKLSEKNVREYFSRMGLGYESKKGQSFALIPAYRTDVLHWADLVEEVAIAYGYDNFEPEIPAISTIASEHDFEKKRKLIADILAGAGLLEASTYHIAARKNIKKMHFDCKDFIELEDSKTERDVLRVDLLTNLLQVISENSDSSYPQKVFEIGRVFKRDESSRSETGVIESEHLAITVTDDEIGFTELKQIVDYLFKMLDVEYSIRAVDDSNFIIGRVGAVIVDGKEIGRIGEIAPRVIKNWKIKTPVSALEINLDKLF